MRTWSRTALAVLAIATGGAVVAGCGADNGGAKESEGVTKDTIKVGSISDVTGPSAAIQGPWLHGLQSSIKAANQAGGIGKRQIELVSEDDKYDAGAGLAAYKKLVSQTPVIGIAFSGSSNVAAAVLPRVARDKVPIFGGFATAKNAETPFNPWFFALAPTYADQADVLMGYAKRWVKKDQPRVAVIHNGTVSGPEFADLVKARAGGGAAFAGSVVLPPTATSADAQVQKIVSMKPDVIAFHGSGAGANLILRAEEKLGTSIPMIGLVPSGGPIAYKGISPKYGDNYEYLTAFTPATTPEPGTSALLAAAKAAGYAQEANNPDFVNGYVAGQIVVNGLKKAGDDLSREGLRKGLEKLTDLDTGGLSAAVTYGAKDHVGPQELRPAKWDYARSVVTPIGQYQDYSSFLSNEYVPK
jgi:branched-chain amino acid transport system substrate-binding protein